MDSVGGEAKHQDGIENLQNSLRIRTEEDWMFFIIRFVCVCVDYNYRERKKMMQIQGFKGYK